MTIKQCIKKRGWGTDIDLNVPHRSMEVDIVFMNDEGREDETEFCINAYDVNELDELFTEFCKENGLKRNTVTNIIIVRTYEETADKVDLDA